MGQFEDRPSPLAFVVAVSLFAILALILSPSFPGHGDVTAQDQTHPAEVGAAILAALLAGMAVGAYLQLWRPPGIKGMGRTLLLVSLITGGVTLAKVSFSLTLPDENHLYLRYIVPVAAVPMLVASLLDGGLALITATVIAALAAIVTMQIDPVRTHQPWLGAEVAATYLAAGTGGALLTQRIGRLGRYAWSALVVALVSLATLLAFWLLDDARRGSDLPWIVMATLLGGGLSTTMAVGAMIVLGYLFGMVTRFQLLDLAQADHPLLRQLQERAPGTYHHSLIVSDLAERAAQAVNADPLLTRVGCLFHDVGKLFHPNYFVENQGEGESPHDALTPQESAKAIIEHVKAGLQLARRYRLPPAVRAFINEHHGTRLVTYFYRKAAAQEPETDPEPFRYPGPKPQTKETAIAMLADSVEAVVRAARDHSPEHIDELVDSVIRERLAEGQLDECDLTLRDVKVVAQAFKATLRAIYHPRIEYPTPTEAELRSQRGLFGPQESLPSQ